MTPINPPDEYTVEWGTRYEDGRTIWWGTGDLAERLSLDSECPILRCIGPTLYLQEGDDEPRD